MGCQLRNSQRKLGSFGRIGAKFERFSGEERFLVLVNWVGRRKGKIFITSQIVDVVLFNVKVFDKVFFCVKIILFGGLLTIGRGLSFGVDKKFLFNLIDFGL